MDIGFSKLLSRIVLGATASLSASASALAQGRPSYIWESEYWESPKIYISLAIAAILGVIWGIASAIRSKKEQRRDKDAKTMQ